MAIAAHRTRRIAAEGVAVIYVADALGQASSRVQQLRAFVTWQGLQLVDIYSDSDSSAHPSARPGLSAALERMRCGVATALVMDERACACMPDGLWLKIAVQAGGVFCAVPIDSMGGLSPNVDAISAFLEAFRPRGLCQGDMG